MPYIFPLPNQILLLNKLFLEKSTIFPPTMPPLKYEQLPQCQEPKEGSLTRPLPLSFDCIVSIVSVEFFVVQSQFSNIHNDGPFDKVGNTNLDDSRIPKLCELVAKDPITTRRPSITLEVGTTNAHSSCRIDSTMKTPIVLSHPVSESDTSGLYPH